MNETNTLLDVSFFTWRSCQENIQECKWTWSRDLGAWDNPAEVLGAYI